MASEVTLWDVKNELFLLQDALEWKHVKPVFRSDAARWARSLERAECPAQVWKLAAELADFIKPGNMLARWHDVGADGEPPVAVSWAREINHNDTRSVLRSIRMLRAHVVHVIDGPLWNVDGETPLDAGGGGVDGGMTTKRKARDPYPESNDAAESNEKRYRKALEEAADEFVCPITQELPVDPVIAEDGRVYERSALSSWIEQRTRQEAKIKSPVTNEPMGAKLLPAVQVRNLIKGMVTSGALTGPKVDAWKMRIEEEAVVAALQRKAEDGDLNAMNDLGDAHRLGTKGLTENWNQAFRWYKRSADLDDPVGISSCAACYVLGKGCEKNEARALVSWGQAAILGHELSCYQLGEAHRKGLHGLGKDEREAARWFRRMPSCSSKSTTKLLVEKAANFVREHDAKHS